MNFLSYSTAEYSMIATVFIAITSILGVVLTNRFGKLNKAPLIIVGFEFNKTADDEYETKINLCNKGVGPFIVSDVFLKIGSNCYVMNMDNLLLVKGSAFEGVSNPVIIDFFESMGAEIISKNESIYLLGFRARYKNIQALTESAQSIEWVVFGQDIYKRKWFMHKSKGNYIFCQNGVLSWRLKLYKNFKNFK